MTPEEQTYARYRLERAREALDEAKLLLDASHPLAAVNRLYYACFYCVSALLLTEGQSSSKHSGVRALFEREWVNTGRVAVSMGRFYRRMFDHRQEADYADLVAFEPDEVRQWHRDAVTFLEQISRLVEEQLGDDGERE